MTAGKRRIVLYKTGETHPSLKPTIGCYERWFSRVLGEAVRLELHLAWDKPAMADAKEYDGIILSGSPRSLVEPEPWMDEAAEWLRGAAAAGVPVLGVCFGHQLIGHAWGGKVRTNPRGWEVGTVSVELTSEGAIDPLFTGLAGPAGLGGQLHVNESHRDEIETLGPEMRTLARGQHTEHQAVAVGEHVRGVQFHPEMDAGVVRNIIAHRRQILDEDAARHGTPPVEERLRQTKDTPDGERVLRNFLHHFVAKS